MTHDPGPPNFGSWGREIPGYFRKIQVGEIWYFGQIWLLFMVFLPPLFRICQSHHIILSSHLICSHHLLRTVLLGVCFFADFSLSNKFSTILFINIFFQGIFSSLSFWSGFTIPIASMRRNVYLRYIYHQFQWNPCRSIYHTWMGINPPVTRDTHKGWQKPATNGQSEVINLGSAEFSLWEFFFLQFFVGCLGLCWCRTWLFRLEVLFKGNMYFPVFRC